MLDAVYIDARKTKLIVAIRPKPPFKPVFQVAAAKEWSEIRIINEPIKDTFVFLGETGQESTMLPLRVDSLVKERMGWLYLAGHKDIFNGEIVGYAMGERMSKKPFNQSLFRAVTAKRPPKGLLHHSDRGSQYSSYEYRQILAKLGVWVSMSGKGNCYDNAPMENFWGERLNKSWSITVTTPAAGRHYGRLQNTLRSPIIVNGYRQN